MHILFTDFFFQNESVLAIRYSYKLTILMKEKKRKLYLKNPHQNK